MPVTPARSEILELVQVGKETTFLTPVAANKRLLAMDWSFDPIIPVEMVRGSGKKSGVGTVPAKEQTNVSASGELAFGDLLYILNGVLCQGVITTPTNDGRWTVTLGGPSAGTFTLTYGGQTTSGIVYNAAAAVVQTALEALTSIGTGNVLVTGGVGGPYTVSFTSGTLAFDFGALTGSGTGLTGGAFTVVAVFAGVLSRKHVLFPDTDGPDTFESLTVEKGSSLGADRVPGVMMSTTALNLVPESKADMSASGQGGRIEAGITLTPTPTEVPLNVGFPKSIDVYIASTYAALGAGQIAPLDLSWSVADRHSPVYRLKASETTFGKIAEKGIIATGKITVEKDTVADGYLTDLRNATKKFLRFVVKGALIEGVLYHTLVVTMPIAMMKDARTAKSDVHCSAFDFEAIDDSTFGGSVQAIVISTVTGL